MLAAVASAEVIYRIPTMPPATLAKTASVSAHLAEARQTDESVPKVKLESAHEAWKEFVAGLKAGSTGGEA